MIEDIITGLSKLSELLRHLPQLELHVQGQARDVKQVARELGVRYVLEGSVRKAADRVRNYRPADRRRERGACLGRALRSAARGHIRPSGRDHAQLLSATIEPSLRRSR